MESGGTLRFDASIEHSIEHDIRAGISHGDTSWGNSRSKEGCVVGLGAHRPFSRRATAPVSSPLLLLRGLRALSPEVMEGLLSNLLGGPMLVAALAYGLGIRVTMLQRVRLRDVHLLSRTIEVSGRRYQIPSTLFDDLRDFIHERICGSDATIGMYRREQSLFGAEIFEQLRSHVERCVRAGVFDAISPACASVFADLISERFVEVALFALSRNHARRVVGAVRSEGGKGRRGARGAAKVVRVESPLEILEKGPRIVRRNRSGGINAYYLWRVSSAAVHPLR